MAYTKITAEYLVTTPMYLGSSSPSTPSGRIREASFKGALRFWWRAITWHKAYDAAGGNEERAIAQLRQWEAELFGTASDTGSANSHASPFRLRCCVEYDRNKKVHNYKKNSIGWRYLRGQGISDDRKEAFPPGSIIKTSLLLSDHAQVDRLLKILAALGVFGGLGARSRRGVGSVAIQSLQVDGRDEGIVPTNVGQMKQVFDWLGITQVQCPIPPLAAFSRHSRIQWKRENISDFGFFFADWRSYYDLSFRKPHPKKHPNFPDDHDEMLKAALGRAPSMPPKRAVFGLPHNYFFKSIWKREKKGKVFVNYGNANDKTSKKHERHASPFFIHAHAFPDGQIGVLHFVLPNKFVENELSVKHRKDIWKLNFQPDWSVIYEFMNATSSQTIVAEEARP